MYMNMSKMSSLNKKQFPLKKKKKAMQQCWKETILCAAQPPVSLLPSASEQDMAGVAQEST